MGENNKTDTFPTHERDVSAFNHAVKVSVKLTHSAVNFPCFFDEGGIIIE